MAVVSLALLLLGRLQDCSKVGWPTFSQQHKWQQCQCVPRSEVSANFGDPLSVWKIEGPIDIIESIYIHHILSKKTKNHSSSFRILLQDLQPRLQKLLKLRHLSGRFPLSLKMSSLRLRNWSRLSRCASAMSADAEAPQGASYHGTTRRLKWKHTAPLQPSYSS